MTKLPTDFKLNRYGLQVRLVSEDDAEFIVHIRTNPQKARYISPTSTSIEEQKAWISRYKEREQNGTDYYFIYTYNNVLAGVNRIYEIQDNHFIHGSWVFSDEVPPYCALAAGIIAREIAFDILGLNEEVDTAGVHCDNQSVLQYSRMLGVKFMGTRMYPMGKYLTGRLKKEDFQQNKNGIIRLFPKKVLV